MDNLELFSKIKDLGIKLRPTVSLKNIKELEAQLGVELPEDYVLFVTQIGDGWNKQVIKRSIWQEMKITPKAWRTEKEQLEKEVPTLRSERARACHDLAFAEVISYNRANLERVEQNENRQQDRQQGRTKRREEEI